jgi:YYY domain-containing protein
MLKKIILFIITVFLLIAGHFLLQGDYTSFLNWWVTVAILGIFFMPITALLFAGFNDKGYLFSKVIGIAGGGYIMWLFASLHIFKFTATACIICAGIGLLINIAVLAVIKRKRRKENKPFFEWTKLHNQVLNRILTEEVLFLAVFLLFTYIRGFKPEAFGTEKFMDYGFMTSMMRSDYMPPQDFWFSGSLLNYYYGGQYLATFLTKLSFIKVEDGYNIMLMMVGTFAVVLPYSLVNNMIHKYLSECEKHSRIIPALCGAIAGIGVCIAGNMHYPTFQWFEPLVRKFFGIEAATKEYWFPDATRFIGYHPETHDKTIHEFPCYSFVLGDLHAHVVNIMFVITLLGLLFAWMCARRAAKDQVLPLWKEIFSPQIVAISFFIGLFHTTNYWDFPIYYVVSGAVILFTNLIVYNFKRKAAVITMLQGISVFCISEVVCLPFTIMFNKISTEPLLAVNHTPLNQLIILWGLPVFVVISFLCFMVANDRRKRRAEAIEDESVRRSELFLFMESLTITDLFAITIGLCAIGLVIIPEIIYIKDIYSGDYKRANTMFKLTYQAFIMFGICFGYMMVRLLRFGESRRQKITAVICLLLFATSVCYVQNAVNAWYGNIFHINKYKGLDCTAFLETDTDYKNDVGAIDWLNENVTGMPVVLEANGDSYTKYERVSVMTGLPTVLGWRTHEWLWKSDEAILDERAADIETIYTSTDEEQVKNLLTKYNVSYIYVGKLEKDKFSELNNDLIKGLGEIVYISPTTLVKTDETYIVKIK